MVTRKSRLVNLTLSSRCLNASLTPLTGLPTFCARPSCRTLPTSLAVPSRTPCFSRLARCLPFLLSLLWHYSCELFASLTVNASRFERNVVLGDRADSRTRGGAIFTSCQTGLRASARSLGSLYLVCTAVIVSSEFTSSRAYEGGAIACAPPDITQGHAKDSDSVLTLMHPAVFLLPLIECLARRRRLRCC